MCDTKCAVCREPVDSYSIDVNSDEMYYWHNYHDKEGTDHV